MRDNRKEKTPDSEKVKKKLSTLLSIPESERSNIEKQLIDLLENYDKKNNPKINTLLTQWGKEKSEKPSTRLNSISRENNLTTMLRNDSSTDSEEAFNVNSPKNERIARPTKNNSPARDSSTNNRPNTNTTRSRSPELSSINRTSTIENKKPESIRVPDVSSTPPTSLRRRNEDSHTSFHSQKSEKISKVNNTSRRQPSPGKNEKAQQSLTYRAITANCGNDSLGETANIKIASLMKQNLDFCVINCQEVAISKTQKELAAACGDGYVVDVLHSMETSTKPYAAIANAFGNKTGMASFIIYKKDSGVSIESEPGVDVRRDSKRGYNKGGIVTDFRVKKSGQSIHIKSISGHLDSRSASKRTKDWYKLHEAISSEHQDDWFDLVKVIPNIQIAGYDANTRNKAKEKIWDTNAIELDALKQAPLGGALYSASSTYHTDDPLVLSTLDQKRPGYFRGGMLDFVSIEDGRPNPFNITDKNTNSQTRCDIIKPISSESDRDHSVIISPVMSYEKPASDFERVRDYLASQLTRSAPKLAGEMRTLKDDNDANREKLTEIYNLFLRKDGVVNQKIKAHIKTIKTSKLDALSDGLPFFEKVNPDLLDVKKSVEGLTKQLLDYSDIENVDATALLENEKVQNALFRNSTSKSFDTQRRKFAELMIKVDLTLVRQDRAYAENLINSGQREAAAISMEDLLGVEGIKIVEDALAEERNSNAYMAAVFRKAVTHFGGTLAAPIAVPIGGPSSSGKTSVANNLINNIIQEKAQVNVERGAGTDVIFVDGSFSREVSHVRSMLDALAREHGYSGVSDLHDYSGVLDGVKKDIERVALENKISIAYIDTFSNPLSNQNLPDKLIRGYGRDNVYYGMIQKPEVMTPLDYRKTIGVNGEKRAFGLIPQDQIDNAKGIYDFKEDQSFRFESKRYDAGWLGTNFWAGVYGSLNMLRNFRKKGIPDENIRLAEYQLIRVAPEGDGWKVIKDSSEPKGMITVSSGLYDAYLADLADDKPSLNNYSNQHKNVYPFPIDSLAANPNAVRTRPALPYLEDRRLSLEQQLQTRGEETKCLIEKAIAMVEDNNFNLNQCLFDPQGRVLIDIPAGGGISKKTTVSLDVKSAPKLETNFNNRLHLDDDLKRVYDSLQKNRIVPLQHELHYYLQLKLKTIMKMKSKKDVHLPELLAAYKEAEAELNIVMLEKFKTALTEAREGNEINIKKLNASLNKSRAGLSALGLKLLVEKINTKLGKPYLSSLKLDDLKKTAPTVTASSLDFLHVDRQGRLATWISGTQYTAHHRIEGEHVPDRQVVEQYYSLDAQNAVTVTNINPHLQIRVPSIAIKKGMSDGEIVNDVALKLTHIKEKYKLSDNLVGDTARPKAMIYNLYTSLHDAKYPFDGSNEQTKSAEHILKGAHEYNAQQISEKNDAVFCFVQGIPVNNYGIKPGYADGVSTGVLTSSLRNESTLMSEIALLHTLYHVADDSVKHQIKAVFDSYKKYLLTESDERNDTFFESQEGQKAFALIKDIKQTWLAPSVSRDSEEYVDTEENWELAEDVAPDDTTVNADNLVLRVKQSLMKMMANDKHLTKDGRLIQAMSVFVEQASLNGCKSGNERTEMVNARVSVLTRRLAPAAENPAPDPVLTKISEFLSSTPETIDACLEALETAIDVARENEALYSAPASISWFDQGAAAKVLARGTSGLWNTNECESSNMTTLQNSKAGGLQAHNDPYALYDAIHPEGLVLRQIGRALRDTKFWIFIACTLACAIAVALIILFPPAAITIGAGVVVIAMKTLAGVSGGIVGLGTVGVGVSDHRHHRAIEAEEDSTRMIIQRARVAAEQQNPHNHVADAVEPIILNDQNAAPYDNDNDNLNGEPDNSPNVRTRNP